MRGGKWFDVNNGYPAFTKLKKGDIVFNHKQTEQLFKNGYVTGSHARIFGSSYARGTAYSGGSSKYNNAITKYSAAYLKAMRTTTSTKKGYGSTSLSTKTIEDWIERIFTKLENAVSRFSTVVDNVSKSFSVRKTNATNQINATKSLATQSGKAATRYLKEANALGLSKSYVDKIQSGAIDVQWIQNQTSKGKEKNKALLEKISQYIDLYDKSQDALQKQLEAQADLAEAVATRADLIATEYEGKIATEVTKYIDSLETQLDNDNVTHSSADYQKLISYYKKQETYLNQEAEALKKQLNADIKSGYIVKGTEAWYERQQQIDEVTLSANEAKVAQQEAANQRFENIKNEFEAELTKYDTIASLIETYIDTAEAYGFADSTVWYDALRNNSVSNQKQLIAERDALLSQLNADLKAGSAKGGLDRNTIEYNDRIAEIDKLTVQIAKESQAIAEYNQNINEIKWDSFDKVQDKIEEAIDEVDFFIKLISSDELVDDNGNFTAKGEATMALHVKNMGLYNQQAANYANEIKSINASLAKDPYNQDLIDRKSELVSAQQKAIQAAQDEKDEIKDLISDAYDAQLDSLQDIIDKYTDALDAQKDLYDYQKRVQEQTKNIASLQKQLSAYQGDTSEEAKQTIQKLKVELEEAKSDLEETQYDKYITDQKQMLDDFYGDYEDALSSRLDDTDSLIQSAIDSAAANTNSTNNTLTTLANSLGYTISSAISSVSQIANSANQSVQNSTSEADRNAANNTSTSYSQSSISKTQPTNSSSGSGSSSGSSSSSSSNSNSSSSNTSNSNNTTTLKAQTITTRKSSYSVTVGKTTSIGAKASGGTKLSYSSKNTSIAKVNSSGIITGVKAGSTTITISAAASSTYKSASKTITVTVNKASTASSKPTVGTKVKFSSGSYYATASGTGARGTNHLGGYVYVTKISSSGSYPYHISTGSKLGSGDLGWVKASQIGFSRGGFVADYQKVAMRNGDDMVTFNTLKRGEAVLTPTQSQQFKALTDNLPLMNNLVDTAGMVQKLRVANPAQSTSNNYEISLDINIDHVEDYNDLVSQMQKDKNFEKMIQAMTIDQVSGKSALGKYRIKF